MSKTSLINTSINEVRILESASHQKTYRTPKSKRLLRNDFWASLHQELEVNYTIFQDTSDFQIQIENQRNFKSKKLSLSYFNNARDNKPKLIQQTWNEFVSKFDKPQIRASKDGALFSPARFNGNRANENVQELSMIALDYDHNADWENDLSVFINLNITFIAYTSHSHLRAVPPTKESKGNPDAEPRFRVIVPLAHSIPREKYKSLWTFFNNLTNLKIDGAPKALASVFYLPAKADADAPYEYKIFNGETFNWESLDLKQEATICAVNTSIKSNDLNHRENVNDFLKEKLNFLLENEPKFRATWDKKRKDLSENNQSSSDMSIANFAAQYDFTDKEIVSLLVEHRGDYKRDNNGRERLDYYQRTIAKARLWAARLESSDENQDSELLEDNAENLKIVEAVATTLPIMIEECNDDGNANRFVRQHGQFVRYCVERKRWIVYNGKRWKPDAMREIELRAKYTARSIAGEAASKEISDKESEKLLKHAQKSKHAKAIKDMLTMAEPELAIQESKFDRDKWLLNVSNGTIDLHTGQLRGHEREDYITKLIDVNYNPNAQCPTWLAFLNRIMDGNHNLISFLCRAVGYSLTGEVNERAVFVLYGNGANGKSVFAETILSLLGDYTAVAPATAVMKKQSGAPSNDVAKLRGARFVSVNETDEGGRIDESVIKAISGDDKLTARFLYGEFFDFIPEFKLWLRTNHKPTVRGTDEGIWDRLKLIPFAVRIPKHEQNKQLMKELQNELSGILSWAVRGCLEWQLNGLGVPYEVEQATNEYRKEQDAFSIFIEECCVLNEKAWTSTSEIRREYESFCKELGDSPYLVGNVFTERLRALNCDPKTNRKAGKVVRGWSGIGLKSSQIV